MSTSPDMSRMASTSTSVASSKKRSISTGRWADSPPSRPSRAGGGHLGHCVPQIVVGVDDDHGPTPQHVGGPHQHGIADAVGHRQGLLHGGRGAAGGLGDVEAGAQGIPPLPVLGQIDAVGAGAHHQAAGQHPGQLERRLAAERHHDPGDAGAAGKLRRSHLDVDHVADVLLGEGLEVQPVAGVVVSGHRLGVAVDHHGLVPGLRQRERRVDAAVVELDALADPVGARPQDDDLGPVGRGHLAHVLIRGVVVGGLGLELSRAGVDRLECGATPAAMRAARYLGRWHLPQIAELLVGESELLGPLPRPAVMASKPHGFQRSRSSVIWRI